MIKLIFVHIKGDKKGETTVFTKDKVSIGSGESCDLRFDKKNEDISELHAEVSVSSNGKVIIKDADSKTGTFVNKNLIKTADLKDGDIISFNKETHSEVCLRIVPSRSKHKLINYILLLLQTLGLSHQSLPPIENSEGNRSDKGNFDNRHTQKVFIIIIFILTASAAFTLFYSYLKKLKDTTKRVETLETQQTSIEDIIEKYRRGVCFIQGNYYLIDYKTDKPVRTKQDGSPFTYNYTGSGFLATKEGFLITNRHIADPGWLIRGTEQNRYIEKEPVRIKIKFSTLRAFFPEIEKPFPLEVIAISTEVDVAILKFDTDGYDLPVFKLDTSGNKPRIGVPVILLGYPAGINAIFGKADQKIVDKLMNLPVLKIAEELSNRNLISPLVTQGHIVDISKDKIVYDAQTTFGGSGGPLIDINGKVIGINYGILKSFKGSNFGVPIEFGIKLLKKQSTSN